MKGNVLDYILAKGLLGFFEKTFSPQGPFNSCSGEIFQYVLMRMLLKAPATSVNGQCFLNFCFQGQEQTQNPL